MSDIKCPFCQQELESVLQLAGAGGLVEEAYLLCSKCNIRGERKLWQELIRTRKALDVAILYIKHTQRVEPFWFNRLANKTMDEIKTALEQKE